MAYTDIWSEISTYIAQINFWELSGLITGILAVVFLIRQQILTWPSVAYVLVSFVVFWEARLYGDFLLHVIFLILNIYGWVYWVKGAQNKELPVTQLASKTLSDHFSYYRTHDFCFW